MTDRELDNCWRRIWRLQKKHGARIERFGLRCYLFSYEERDAPWAPTTGRRREYCWRGEWGPSDNCSHWTCNCPQRNVPYTYWRLGPFSPLELEAWFREELAQ